MVSAYLDRQRAAVRALCAELGEQPPAHPAPLSPHAVAAHLTWVEHHWFEVVMLGRPDRVPRPAEGCAGGGRADGPPRPLAVLLDEYDAQCARSRAVTARLEQRAGARVVQPGGSRVTLRWVLLHVLEETARQGGRLDLLRSWPQGAAVSG
ncbi:DUF664 domain-containing protein [Nocardiopsis sp. CNT-189]|uniref:mycothiol transferase n=1 Tax=Nocardiopsis oceanisediminis TaxID=2816862 RepID=UPI003B37D690